MYMSLAFVFIIIIMFTSLSYCFGNSFFYSLLQTSCYLNPVQVNSDFLI